MDARRDTRPGPPAMIQQFVLAGCSEIRALPHPATTGWRVPPRGARLTLSWDEGRGALTLIRYLPRRDGATVVGRYRLLQPAAAAAATL